MRFLISGFVSVTRREYVCNTSHAYRCTYAVKRSEEKEKREESSKENKTDRELLNLLARSTAAVKFTASP